jgi:hypothetical protein
MRSSSLARWSAEFSASVRARARRAIPRSSLSLSSSASTASSVVDATAISPPGVKNCSSPAQVSDRIGTPHAAASNSRPDGQ